jgi:glycogen operon protein
MLLGGDEIGRTQLGNNNGYCQDSEVSWYDWGAVDEDMLDFTRRLLALRREHPVFRRNHWFRVGVPDDAPEDQPRDIEWCTPSGARMRDGEWHTDGAAAIAVYLSGAHLYDESGTPLRVDSFYLALNATAQALDFSLPAAWLGGRWRCVFDTAAPRPFEARAGDPCMAAEPITLADRSLVLVRRVGAG